MKESKEKLTETNYREIPHRKVVLKCKNRKECDKTY